MTQWGKILKNSAMVFIKTIIIRTSTWNILACVILVMFTSLSGKGNKFIGISNNRTKLNHKSEVCTGYLPQCLLSLPLSRK
jgi:hypothetical protein